MDDRGGRRLRAAFRGPKQFVALAGRPLLAWALEAAAEVSTGVVVVVPADRLEHLARLRPQLPGIDAVVAGGATRSESVRAGLAAVPATAGIVAVHDEARPLADRAVFRRVIDAVASPDGAAGAIPGVALTDTLRSNDGSVVDRDTLIAVQTPQAFRADVAPGAPGSSRGHRRRLADRGLRAAD